MKLRDLSLRIRALFRPATVETELNEELEFHLERETEKLVETGMSPADARRLARARFGSVALAADECRDARGTSFIDGVVRDLGYALRMFRRAPLPAVTIIGTLGLGLGLVAVVFTIMSPFLFRVDAVPNPGELFEVQAPVGSGDARQSLTRADFDAFRRDTQSFSDPFAMIEDIDSRIDGRMMAGTLVTGNFFQALGVRAAAGRALVPDDDDRTAPRPLLVLSHRGWVRRFDSDPNIVGRRLTINGFSYEIAGVMPEGFRGIAISAPDYWAPLSVLAQVRPIHLGHEDSVAVEIVGRLRPGVSKSAAAAEIGVWYSRTSYAVKNGEARIELLPRQGTIKVPTEALLLFAPLFFTFGLILVIACANVANLLLARGMSRQREIGIRLAIGATRSRIVRQLLTENLLLALAAAGVGYFVSRLLVVATIRSIANSLAPELGEMMSLSIPESDWRVGVFLVAGAIVSTLFFALSPSLQATRLELVRTIRGEVSRDGRPARARNILIGIQVMASALLLTCSAVFLRSALASATVDPGFRVSDTVMIEINNEPKRAAMLRAVESTPFVTAIAASWPDMLGGSKIVSASVASTKIWATCKFVSPEFMDVLGLEIVRGRGFVSSERTADAGVAVVSEALAKRLRPNGEVLGEILQLGPNTTTSPTEGDPPFNPRAVTIVGIRRDIAGLRLSGDTEAGVYLPTNAASEKSHLIVRVSGDVDNARLDLLTRLTAVDPDMGQVMTMKTMAKMETYVLNIAFWVTVVLGGIALALTLSGLFSVLSYLVEQRTKEIGVRMALGAGARSVAWLVFAQTFRPVGIGLVLGCGFAALLAIIVRSISTEISNIVHVLDPIAYAASIAVIVSACACAALFPARKAVRIDPIASLRQD